MNCVLFAKMDKVFSKKKKNLKILGKMENNPVCQSGKWEPCECQFTSNETLSHTNKY